MRHSPAVAMRWCGLIAIALTVGSFASVGWAGMLNSTTRALNYNATTWKGAEHLSGVASFGSNKIEADVEYAVFTSKRFQEFLGDNGLSHTYAPLTAALNAGELIYAYQVINIVAPTNAGITVVQVGKDTTDVVGLVSPPWYVETGLVGIVQPPTGTTPTSTGPTSLKWSFTNDIDIGEISPILIFSSPKLPEWAEITVSSGIASDPDDVFAPTIGPIDFEVPEPATFALASLGLILLLGARKRVY